MMEETNQQRADRWLRECQEARRIKRETDKPARPVPARKA